MVAGALGLGDTEPGVLLGWYDEIVAAVDRVSVGGEIGPDARAAMDALARHVGGTIEHGDGVLPGATATLAPDEVVSNAAVMMFGGIETSEGMTTSLFWHLLTNRDQWAAVAADPSLAANAVEESLRLEPAAGRVDRYATTDGELGGAEIRAGDLVIVSLTAANRDPATFPDPDAFDIARPNARSHLAFAQGPHACVGLHLAQARDTVGAVGRAGRLAGPRDRTRFDAAQRRHLPEAALTAGALGCCRCPPRVSRRACSRARRCPSVRPWRRGSRRRRCRSAGRSRSRG